MMAQVIAHCRFALIHMIFPSLGARNLRVFGLVLAGLLAGGCATAPGRTTPDDPWQGLNRAVYRFNDVIDKAAVKPTAKAYRKITPQWLRTGVGNFFNNLELPWTIVNQLLQGKPKLMALDTCRLVVNSTVGLGGVIDVASRLELPADEEDFGQTLAVWGVPSGPYVMLPFFGPSSLRDGPGRGVDYFGRPLRYLDIPWETQLALNGVNVISSRERLLSVEGTLESAYDKYGVLRDVWVQQREYAIFDGNPPEEPLDPELQEAEKESAAAP